MRGLFLGLLAMAGMLARRQILPYVPARRASIDRSPHDDALFRAFIKACPDLIWLKDADGIYVGCNDAAATMLGKTRTALVGKSDAQLFPAEIAQKHRAVDLAVLAERRCKNEEIDQPADGAIKARILDMTKCPVIRADGQAEGVLGIARDVTPHRRQERKLHEQATLLQDMSLLAQVGGWEIDVDAGTFAWTEQHARLHELDPDEALTLEKCIEHYIPEDQVYIRAALARTFKTGDAFDRDIEMVLASGAHKWIRAHWRATVRDGRVTRIWGMAQDVSERRKLDESIRMANLIYRTSTEAIVVTDDQDVIVDANPAFQRMLGYTLGEIVGALPRAFLVNPDDDALLDTIRHSLDDHGRWAGEGQLRRKDGGEIAAWVQINIIREPDGLTFRRAIHVLDLTEQKDKNEQIWRQANFDGLTDLPNRSLLLDRLSQEIRNNKADGLCVGTLCIDLDRFTDVNDMVGHARGDALLVQTAARARASLPASATLSRLGGNRFAAILTGAPRQVELCAQALVDALAAPFALDADSVHVSASVGISLFPEDAQEAHGLLNAAEQAMSAAKRAGGNRLQYFSPAIQQTVLARMRMTNELRHALGRRQLCMYYQPIVEASTGRIRKAEALLRWRHPVYGLVGPADFIPLAEESGLIVEIGDWVIAQAIGTLERWRRQLHVDIELSVNQSPLQFEEGVSTGWIDRVVGAGLRHHSITVEITESMLVNDSTRMQTSLKLLQNGGAKISLDDFGTGFSALSYLKLFPVDYLKIDKSFIHQIEHDANDQALTQAIIEMAHKLQIKSIAEGVETPGQRDILTRYGCDYLQGYLYARPVALEHFEALLRPQASGAQG